MGAGRGPKQKKSIAKIFIATKEMKVQEMVNN